jgi:23S rRNA (guanine2445-N2)-methyltransferase / 23S rRNA (guanine2069-N7)-methyltransferase
MSSSTVRPLVAKTLIGLEQVLANELESLGARNVSTGKTVVYFEGNKRLLYLANLACRTAIRILLPIAKFGAENQHDLYQGIQSIDWVELLDAGGSLAVDAVVRDSFSTNSLYVAQLTKDAVVDQFRDRLGSRPSVELNDPDLRINVHLHKWQATISVDSSGESLHKRGYQTATGDAPLNEVLAAGILQLTRWDRQAPLVDFMCGSGTLPIEAAMWARGIAPGLLRQQYGFMRWTDFDKGLLHQLRSELSAKETANSVTIVGSDVDPAVLELARQNAQRAGVAEAVQWRPVSFDELDPPGAAGVIVTNPPYDERLKLAHRSAFYRRIGDTLKRRWGGYTAYLLASDTDTPRELGLRSSGKVRLFNGPIECRLLRFDLARGEMADSLPESPPETIKIRPRAGRGNDFSDFTNRLRRMARHWLKWARRQGLEAVRLYDRDVPEVPCTIDWYGGWLHVEEHDRPHARSPIEQQRWLDGLLDAIRTALEISPDQIYFKWQGQRSRLWKPSGDKPSIIDLKEAHCCFRLPIAEASWQLPLDLRTIRSLVEKEAAGKQVLLLGDRAASATVAAAVGGAKATVTVAAEPTVATIRASLQCSGAWQGKRQFLTVDLLSAVEQFAGGQFDLVLAAPPLFLSKEQPVDYRAAPQQHAEFVNRLLPSLTAGGRIYYISNARRFKLLDTAIQGASVREISRQTVPPDFRDKRVHRCWLLQRSGQLSGDFFVV